MFKGMESGMARGMFEKAKFKGKGTFIKDIGNAGMDIGKGMLKEVGISIEDLESGEGVVSDEERLEVAVSCASLVMASEDVVVVVVAVELGVTSDIGISDWITEISEGEGIADDDTDVEDKIVFDPRANK